MSLSRLPDHTYGSSPRDEMDIERSWLIGSLMTADIVSVERAGARWSDGPAVAALRVERSGPLNYLHF